MDADAREALLKIRADKLCIDELEEAVTKLENAIAYLSEDDAQAEDLKEILHEVNTRIHDDQWVVIDKSIEDIHKVRDNVISYSSRYEWTVFEDDDAADAAAREYYEDMLKNDERSFRDHVGDETLIQWGLGQWACEVQSLEDWLDNVSADGVFGEPVDISFCSLALVEDLGFTPTVAYARN